MKKKLKFEAQQYGKSYKKPRRNKCMEIKIHALYLFLRRGAERPPALPNAFSVGNIAEKPGGEKERSGSSEGDVSGISASDGRGRRRGERKRRVMKAVEPGRFCAGTGVPNGRPEVWRSDGQTEGALACPEKGNWLPISRLDDICLELGMAPDKRGQVLAPAWLYAGVLRETA